MESLFIQQAELQVLRGDFAEALKIARMGLTLAPDSELLLEMAATCATHLQQDELAADLWERLWQRRPESAAIGNQLGLALEKLDRFDEAENAFRKALVLASDDAHLHTNLGLLLENQGRLDEALASQRAALERAPESAAVHSNLAGLLEKLRQDGEAEAHYREAIRHDPNFAQGYSNLGVLLCAQGRDGEAEGYFRQALALAPEAGETQANLGQMLLAHARYAEGWPLFEGRLQSRAAKGRTEAMARAAGCPSWQGEVLAGKTVLVVPEQGMGDGIQFCRYLPWLKAQGAERLIYLCRPEQLALMQGLAGPDIVAGLETGEQYFAEADYWVFLMSLPWLAGTTEQTIPPVPYLSAEPERIARLAPYMESSGPRIGFVWRGNPQHSNDAARSLPGPETLAPLWRIPGLSFFSLQKSPVGLPPLPADQPCIDLGPLLHDFADTAAALVQLDLLICVDTSTAHLAGALGVPCWVLLPSYKTDWRWQRDRADSPWYPSLRLFRQTVRDDWATPLAAVAEALAQWAKARRS